MDSGTAANAGVVPAVVRRGGPGGQGRVRPLFRQAASWAAAAGSGTSSTFAENNICISAVAWANGSVTSTVTRMVPSACIVAENGDAARGAGGLGFGGGSGTPDQDTSARSAGPASLISR